MTNEEILEALQVAELTREQPKLHAIYQLVLMELDEAAEAAKKTLEEKLEAKKKADEAKVAAEANKAKAEANKVSDDFKKAEPTPSVHTSSSPLPRF